MAEFGNLDCKGGETSPSRAESVLRSSSMSEDFTVSARSSFIHRSRIRLRLRPDLSAPSYTDHNFVKVLQGDLRQLSVSSGE